MGRTAAICVSLLASVWFVYGQTRSFDFVSYDDSIYVTENPQLAQGFSADGFAYALTTRDLGFYHPITMVSLLADYEFYGLEPAGYHMHNVALHGLNTLMLFGLLQYATRRRFASAAVAALFAVHPLHVESVAWIAERKDVLSTFFGFGCLWTYVVYTRTRSRGFYWLSVALLVVGLLSKSMLVTVPVLLLLLDRWPLERLTFPGVEAPARAWWARVRPFLFEKTAFIAVAGAAAVATFWFQHQAGAMGAKAIEDGSAGLSWAAIPNVIVSYARYVAMTVWPSQLSALYPHPTKPHAGGIPLADWQVAIALLFLVITTIVISKLRRPEISVGWIWYLVSLLPVIGIVQIGSHALADRYMYLPAVGLFILVCFGIATRWEERTSTRTTRVWRTVGVLLVLGAYADTARTATSVWRGSESLYTHAIEINPRNTMMHYNLGNFVRARGENDRAIQLFRKVIEIDPGHFKAHINLGEALAAKDAHEEAVAAYEFALRIRPLNVIAHNNLANSLKALGRFEEADRHYRTSIANNAGNPLPHYNLGNLLMHQERYEEAEAEYRAGLALNPDHAGALCNLGNCLVAMGRSEEAIEAFRRALALEPASEVARRGLQIATGRAENAVSAPPPPPPTDGPGSSTASGGASR